MNHSLIKLIPLIGRIREASATCLRRLRSGPLGDDTSTAKKSFEDAFALELSSANRSEGNVFDVVVTPNEVNAKHGTGFLVRRIFEGRSNLLSIRGANHWGGDHSFGDQSILLSHTGLTRSEAFGRTSSLLQGKAVHSVTCVPYFPDDLLTSIIIKELFKVPLCCYLMDDQSITESKIPDELMREFLSKCSLRLTTHSEMRDAYERKFGFKFYLMPAVVPGRLVTQNRSKPATDFVDTKRGALVGSIWSSDWYERLKATLRSSGYRCDWYGNSSSPGFKISREDLVAAGINAMGIVSEDELAERLKRYPYAVVPTGTLVDDAKDCGAPFAKLSLPGRILFTLATSNTPIIVLGSEKTSAARFVKFFEIGFCSDYSAESFGRAVERICTFDTQVAMRDNAIKIAPAFCADSVTDWLFRSLELGVPADERFEKIMPQFTYDWPAK